MPLYEVEIKTRIVVEADDRKQAKAYAMGVACNLPIKRFDIAASRSLKEFAPASGSASSKQLIGK